MALRTFIAGDNMQKLKCSAQIVINKSYCIQHKAICYGNKRDRHYYTVQSPLILLK